MHLAVVNSQHYAAKGQTGISTLVENTMEVNFTSEEINFGVSFMTASEDILLQVKVQISIS